MSTNCSAPHRIPRPTISLDTDLSQGESGCPTRNTRIPGPRVKPGKRAVRVQNPAPAARAARSARRRLSVVLELLRGADLESTSRKYGVTAATLSEWREAFLAAGEKGLKIRQENLVDEQGRRMNSVIAELAMENELLRERIRRMEDEKPYFGWRSKR